MKLRDEVLLLGPLGFFAAIAAVSTYLAGWHPVWIVLYAGLFVSIALGRLVRAVWEEWSPKWFANVTKKEDTARRMAAEEQNRRMRRMAEGRRALYQLRKLDPEAAERIAEAVDSGKVSPEDLTALVARARQDALSVGRSGNAAQGQGPPAAPGTCGEGPKRARHG